MIPVRAAARIGGAALAAAAALAGACASHPAFEGPPPALEVRLAEFAPTEGWSQMQLRTDSRPIWVAPEPLLGLADFRDGLVRNQGGRDFLLLNVREGAKVRLENATVPHVDHPLAVMLDGAVIYAPTLKTSISRQVPVRIGPGGISVEEAERVEAALEARKGFLGIPLLPRPSPAVPPGARSQVPPAPAAVTPAPPDGAPRGSAS